MQMLALPEQHSWYVPSRIFPDPNYLLVRFLVCVQGREVDSFEFVQSPGPRRAQAISSLL